jgi:cytochrome c oxidase cbb3-type subunit 3
MAPTPAQHYDTELARAAEIQLARQGGGEVTNESLLLMSQIPDRLAQGRQIFDQFCVVCHSSQGEGNVGPNLTDDYWLHGGSPLEILDTVENGVPEKGMVAWGNQLGPARVQAVTAFILSIKNTDVPGKAPQGEPESAVSPEETGAEETEGR